MFEWTTPLFSDPSADVVGSVLAFVTVVLSSTGGIGGGGLLVPLYMLVMNLGRYAIPLSKATIMGSAIANVLMNWKRRHPSADRPLIAFDVALMLEPSTLAGTVVGVTLNTLFPRWLVTVLLVALLGYTAKKTLNKALQTYHKETSKSWAELRKAVVVLFPKYGKLTLPEMAIKHEQRLDR